MMFETIKEVRQVYKRVRANKGSDRYLDDVLADALQVQTAARMRVEHQLDCLRFQDFDSTVQSCVPCREMQNEAFWLAKSDKWLKGE